MHRGGYFRHKISSTLEERRARRRRTNSDEREEVASTTNYSSSFTSGATRYSGLLRQTSEHDFLLVEDDKPAARSRSFGDGSSNSNGPGRTIPQENGDSDDDIAHAHLPLLQQPRAGSEEPISEMDLEKLDMLDDDEEPQGKPSVSESSDVKCTKKEEEKVKKVWEVADTSVYEQQLELLQDQLTSALIENQSLKSE